MRTEAQHVSCFTSWVTKEQEGQTLSISYSLPFRPHYPAEVWSSEASLFTQHHPLSSHGRPGQRRSQSGPQLALKNIQWQPCLPPQVARTPVPLRASSWETIIHEDLMALTLFARFSEAFLSAPGRSSYSKHLSPTQAHNPLLPLGTAGGLSPNA